jgi:hypothetical protein
VPWLFDRFRRARRRPAGTICYLRENGPIAYELTLFGESARERLEAMFDTGLSWYWRTEKDASHAESGEWIELTRWSMAALLAEIGDAARMLIVGIEPQDARTDLARDIVLWSRRFATDERSPLQIVVHHGSANQEHVFVAQQPSERVRALLQAWGIDRARAERRAYPRLHDQSLESVMEKLGQ